MIHYHGTPMGGTRDECQRFISGRHMFIPFLRQEDLGVASEYASSFAFDNSAYTAWKQGITVDWGEYYRWCKEWARHPGFDWAIIPDVVDGTEKENQELIQEWDKKMWSPVLVQGVPVWHMHESLDRLERLCGQHRRVAIGSSGEFPTPGTEGWWDRMETAMLHICDGHGRPPCKLHGLRMLSREIFPKLPFASADSTNVAQNSNLVGRFGMYVPATSSQRAAGIASTIECHQSAPCFQRQEQGELFQ